jgi:hypothetical protein
MTVGQVSLADLIARLPAIRWFIATVVSIQAGDHSITLAYRGATVPHCAYMESYTPAVDDVVHVVTDQHSGLLVLGKEMLRPATPPPTPPAPTTVAPVGSGSYRTDPPPPGWIAGAGVQQSPTVDGAWFYDQAALQALNGVVMAKLEISLNVAAGSDPLSFVVHDNSDTSAPLVWQSMLYMWDVSAIMGTLAWVPLPLNWAKRLTDSAQPGKGIGLASDLYSAVISSGGTLRFTPL